MSLQADSVRQCVVVQFITNCQVPTNSKLYRAIFSTEHYINVEPVNQSPHPLWVSCDEYLAKAGEVNKHIV